MERHAAGAPEQSEGVSRPDHAQYFRNTPAPQRKPKRGGGEASLAIDELSECLPGGSDPARTAENNELLRSIDAFLSLLPKRERVIFLGRYFYALTAEEIAARLGMKTAAVKTSLYRTRKRLAQKLEEEGY